MSVKQIRIEIDLDGNCTAEGIGFVGPECERALREIDRALGTRTGSRRKPEHATRTQDSRRTIING